MGYIAFNVFSVSIAVIPRLQQSNYYLSLRFAFVVLFRKVGFNGRTLHIPLLRQFLSFNLSFTQKFTCRLFRNPKNFAKSCNIIKNVIFNFHCHFPFLNNYVTFCTRLNAFVVMKINHGRLWV